MVNKITTGAYVIRKKGTSTVIHSSGTSLSGWSWVEGYEQDETTHRDQQIWWIEPLPNQESEELIYSITNTSSGNALSLKDGDGNISARYPQECSYEMKLKKPLCEGLKDVNTYLTASPETGKSCQKWKIYESHDDDDRPYYTISSVENNQVIFTTEGGWVFTKKQTSRSADQLWEFVIPAVAFPPGWVQIQNVGTGDLLNQIYPSAPIEVIRPPSPVRAPQYHDSWGTQWTLIRAKAYSSGFPSRSLNGPWCIKNRLTQTFLSSPPNDIAVWGTKIHDIEPHTWKLELDSDSNWKVISNKTSYLIEVSQVSPSSGAGALCVSKAWTINKSWVFKSPVVRAAEEPPSYESSV